MRNVLLVLFSVAFLQPVLGQLNLSGVVIDAETKVAIPYVNIGIIKKRLGTVSNISGKFSLDIPENLMNDSIRFSCIGYHSFTVLAGTYLKRKANNLKVELRESKTALRDVEVKAQRLTRKEFGVTRAGSVSATSFHGFQEGPTEDLLGSEMGMRIKPKKFPSLLVALKFYIRENEFDSLKLRINIYKTENEVVLDNLAPRNIIIDIGPRQTGWVEIDLEKYNMVVNGDFIASLECIGYKVGQRDFVLIPTFFPSFQKTFQKYTSQDAWLVGSYGIALNVTLEY